MKKITPKMFRNLFQLALVEVCLDGLRHDLDFDNLFIRADLFSPENYNKLRNSYNEILSYLRSLDKKS